MSRSRKKNNYSSNVCCNSEKKDKRLNNRKIRRINKKILKDTLDEDQLIPEKTLKDVWNMGKDGKHRVTTENCGEEYYNKLMRK